MPLKPRRERFAICLIFLLTGVAMSSWAPMVPYVKARMGLDEEQLGLLLLALGSGAIVMMPVGIFSINRLGSRKTIFISVVIASVVLPCLAIISNPVVMAAALFIFGGVIGMIDVSMNTQAVIVEKRWMSPIMSSFHGLYSVGGILGAASISILLKLGMTLAVSAMIISGLFIVAIVWQYSHLLPHSGEDSASGRSVFAIPQGFVVFIGILCFISFLAEGALLDWSAVYLKYFRNVEESNAGIGFAVFSVTMSIGRLTGDYVAARIGLVRGVRYGAWVAAIGYFMAVGIPNATGTLAGFGLIGLGLSNVVPLLFSAAGNIKNPPPSISIPAITTMGYAGLLLGPALIGFVAKKSTLTISLGILGIALVCVALGARFLRK